MKQRKKIYYMDLSAVENNEILSPIEHITRERLLTTRDWDRFIFWMDFEAALELLSNHENHCFVLSFIEGYTEEEIAIRLKIAHQTVSKKIKKAKMKIRNYLKEGYNAP